VKRRGGNGIPRRGDSKWIKLPATWLRDECWLEEPQPPRSREPKSERAPRRTAKAESAEWSEPNDDYPPFPLGAIVWLVRYGTGGEVTDVLKPEDRNGGSRRGISRSAYELWRQERRVQVKWGSNEERWLRPEELSLTSP
jgi:hypothetical protein